MSKSDNLDEILYRQLFDYERAVQNAANRFKKTEEANRILHRADGRLRYWVHIYISAIDLFEPDPLQFNRQSVQSEILRNCVDCGMPELREKFRDARDNAWGALVRMAEKSLIGENAVEPFDLEDRKKKMEIGLLVKKSIDPQANQDAWMRLEREIEAKNKGFLHEIALRMKGSEKEAHFVRYGILSLWVHPDYPLWLMEVEPARKLLEALLRKWKITESGVVTRKNYENTKARLKKDEKLITNGKAVIKGLRFSTAGDRSEFAGYEMTAKFEEALPKLPPFEINKSRPPEWGPASYELATHIRK